MIAIDENKEIMGIGKITKMVNDNDATFAIVIKDKWQGRGLGAKLLNALLDIAKDRGYHMLKAFMFVNNERMISLCKKMGFSLASVKGGKYVKATLKIHQSS
jgi:acetyltransferase